MCVRVFVSVYVHMGVCVHAFVVFLFEVLVAYTHLTARHDSIILQCLCVRSDRS